MTVGGGGGGEPLAGLLLPRGPAMIAKRIASKATRATARMNKRALWFSTVRI